MARSRWCLVAALALAGCHRLPALGPENPPSTRADDIDLAALYESPQRPPEAQPEAGATDDEDAPEEREESIFLEHEGRDLTLLAREDRALPPPELLADALPLGGFLHVTSHEGDQAWWWPEGADPLGPGVARHLRLTAEAPHQLPSGRLLPALRLGECFDELEGCTEEVGALAHAYHLDLPSNQGLLIGLAEPGVSAPLQPAPGSGEHRVLAVRYCWSCPERGYQPCLYHGPLPLLRQLSPPAMPPGGWVLAPEPPPEAAASPPRGDPLARLGAQGGEASLEVHFLEDRPEPPDDDPAEGELGVWVVRGGVRAFLFGFRLGGMPLHYAQGGVERREDQLIAWVHHSERVLLARAFSASTLRPLGPLISVRLSPATPGHPCDRTLCMALIIPALDGGGRLQVALLDDPEVGFVLFDPAARQGRLLPACEDMPALDQWLLQPREGRLLTLRRGADGAECLTDR